MLAEVVVGGGARDRSVGDRGEGRQGRGLVGQDRVAAQPLDARQEAIEVVVLEQALRGVPPGRVVIQRLGPALAEGVARPCEEGADELAGLITATLSPIRCVRHVAD